MTFSKSEVNRLGERLRAGPPTTLDLELLNDFRRTFAPSFAAVEAAVRELVRGEVSGRPSKTTPSIVAKLRRGTLQLSRMQDIAGIRIVGPDVEWQDETMRALTVRWPESRLVDRRLKPTHGYRAVHVIPSLGQLPVEIQVRTRLQHLWAQVSERGADLAGWDLKYGGGPPALVATLLRLSDIVARLESATVADDPNLPEARRSAELELLDILRDVPIDRNERPA